MQIQNLVLKNGLATPTDWTFLAQMPYGGAKQPAVWMYRKGTTMLDTVTISVAESVSSGGARIISPVVKYPIVTGDATNGFKKQSELIWDSARGFVIPRDVPDQDVKHFRAIVANLLASAMFIAWVEIADRSF